MFGFLKNSEINDLELNLKSWPFEEAKKILQKLSKDERGEYLPPRKGYVLFETGYGPSGLPHIGTKTEVFRMACIRKAFTILTKDRIPTKLVSVSDDMDAIRKVPDNIPEESKSIIKQYIGVALNSVPNPFYKENPEIKSFSDYGNSKLKIFLRNIGFQVENFLQDGKESQDESHFNLNVCCFLSATEAYRCGLFNNGLKEVANKYEKILDIMLPTLGEERRSTYSPFMPIHSDNEITNFVIQHDVISIDAEKCTIKYSYKDKIYEKSFLSGECKLQWKVDFGMRMAILEVDYEFYGKDHWPNNELYIKIANVINHHHIICTFFYELFLDKEGKKISKSKGNGVDIDELIEYTPSAALIYYMYVKPQTAKRLHYDILPMNADTFLALLGRYQGQSYFEKCNNPIFFVYNFLVHFGDKTPFFKNEINYSLLLTLAFVCRAENEEILLNIIDKYFEKKKKNRQQTEEDFDYRNNKTFLDLVRSAINYYRDFYKSNAINYEPNDTEKAMIKVLIDKINADEEKSADSIQNIAYQVGKDFNLDLKSWFSLLYKSILGLESGPRIGSLIAIYGFDKILEILRDKNII